MKARLDMQEMGIRVELAPQQSGKRAYLPPACYTLSRKEKISFCECLSSVKVPSRYSSNPKNIVSMKDLKLVGMKSHDCHVLMQHLLPVSIRGILPKHVPLVITKLCFFFNAICSKVIDPMTLDTLQADIVITLFEIQRSRHEGRLEGQGTLGHKMICPSGEMLDRAHRFVLQHMTEVHPFLQQHRVEIRQMHPSKSGKWVANEHDRSFVKWFKDRCQDNKSTVHNNGVSVEASSTEFDRGNSITSRDIKKSYYGVIEEIWELDYKDFKVARFRYKWFDIKRGVRVDESGFSLVDFNRKRRIFGIDNVEDEDEYDQFDENPPFSIGLPTEVREDNADTNYVRNDHDEGLWIDRQVIAMDKDNADKDNAESSSKKRTRGPTFCKKTKNRIWNQNLDGTLDFDEYGNPVGGMRKDFIIYPGTKVRFRVDINIKTWDVVNQGLKDVILDDIKSLWNLDDSHKKMVLERAAKMWRDFKEISEKAKDSKKHDEHVHFLGPRGYYANRAKWCVDDPTKFLDDSEYIDESIL
ncbi:hypothetical protein AgCh_000404 [Apium graveolens]